MAGEQIRFLSCCCFEPIYNVANRESSPLLSTPNVTDAKPTTALKTEGSVTVKAESGHEDAESSLVTIVASSFSGSSLKNPINVEAPHAEAPFGTLEGTSKPFNIEEMPEAVQAIGFDHVENLGFQVLVSSMENGKDVGIEVVLDVEQRTSTPPLLDSNSSNQSAHSLDGSEDNRSVDLEALPSSLLEQITSDNCHTDSIECTSEHDPVQNEFSNVPVIASDCTTQTTPTNDSGQSLVGVAVTADDKNEVTIKKDEPNDMETELESPVEADPTCNGRNDESASNIMLNTKSIDEAEEELIVISFNSTSDLMSSRIDGTNIMATKSIERTNTTRRIQTLLSGLYEEEKKSCDDDAPVNESQRTHRLGGLHCPASNVKRTVQGLESKISVHRASITNERRLKIGAKRASSTWARKDDSDIPAKSRSPALTGITEKSMELSDCENAQSPINVEPLHTDTTFAWRLILQLVASESDTSSTSDESSTIVSGSFVLSLSASEDCSSRKRMDDLHSIEEMFRQLKVVESRLKSAEQRNNRLYEANLSSQESKDNGSKNSIPPIGGPQELCGREIAIPELSGFGQWREEFMGLDGELKEQTAAFMLNELYREERARIDKTFELENREKNVDALRKIRRYMPVNVRTMSEETLKRTRTPNGSLLPDSVVRKFKRTTVLQLLRIDPHDIERFHPSVLEDLRLLDLTLIERRALHCHLGPLKDSWEGMMPGRFTERRLSWLMMMRNNFVEDLALHSLSFKKNATSRFEVSEDFFSNAIFDTPTCLLDPVSDIDYSGDFGYPETDEYEVLMPGSRELNDLSSKVVVLTKNVVMNALTQPVTLPYAQANDSGEGEDHSWDAESQKGSTSDFFAPVIQMVKEVNEQVEQARDVFASLDEALRKVDPHQCAS